MTSVENVEPCEFVFGAADKSLKGVTMRVISELRFAVAMMAIAGFTAGAGVAQDSPRPEPVSANSTGSTASEVKGASGEPQLQSRDSRYAIHPGDSFDINFELSPEFNQTAVAVQPDGFVSLRGVGDVKVDGQSMPELTRTLQTAYGKILHDPIISVIPKDFEKPYFVADGQVGHPGKYDLRGAVTLTQAIAMAGGFTENSKHSQVLLFRRVSDQWLEAKIFNVKKMEKAGKLAEDPFLHPGDMLFVPKNAFSKFSRFIPSSSLGTQIRPY
jgi:polysaccharide export outer membrane protein